MVAEAYSRNLPFSKAYNFRDVGGYAGLDGRRVRWRRLFRADALHSLDEKDARIFAALGVRTVIDLRRPFEVEKFGRVAESHGVDYHNLVLRHVDWDGLEHPEDAVRARWLADRYLNFAEDGREGIAESLRLIADREAAPVVVHCMAGKDRTGTVCALTLSLLGVSDEDIAADYALTTEAMRPLTESIRLTSPESIQGKDHMFDSPAEAMHLFLDDLRELHGSVESYVKEIGLTDDELAALRSHLLTRSGT
ncbi:protein tyrosine/serine phosphatase [Actinoplanes campanulatus]|uniref:Protein tyrosine/serine phosphatase n=1 Tax=Actinoplanes campanulatus TaxID=113559 RepID=A0A7W5FCG4_9ACTN|nr:tyrosine-protein phosphatase [Actinoplanes campanulatus]MBB3093190.1 protein tyrosine/serine phosphatase [Actinoplanes campanulatus]GGN01841.1 protein-tyrosine-phosphatase [Actinoplanes campanulatus]GID33714.1 protein-tyrosine-phosphatase [Actinoplanes campanulatus]